MIVSAFKQSPKYIKWLSRIGPAALLIVFMYFLAKSYAGNEWLIQIKKTPPDLLIFLGLLSLSNYLLRTLRWFLLFRAVGVDLSFKTTFYSYFSGFSMAVTPGKIGEVIRIWVLRRSENIPVKKSIYPVFGDRVTDLIAVSMLSTLGLGMFENVLIPGMVAIFITCFSALIWLFPNYSIAVILKFIRLFNLRLLKIVKLLLAIKRETRTVKSNPYSQINIIISLLAWLMESIAFYLLLLELGVEVQFAVAASIFAISILVGAISMMPGGIGGTEVVMVTLLLIINVNISTAIAATAIIRALTLWFAVVIGLMTMPFALRYKNPLIDDKSR